MATKEKIIFENYKSKDPNEWRRVLLEIYKDNWVNYGYKDLEGNHPLGKKLKISGVSLAKSVSFLLEHKLIYVRNNMIYLEKEGFELAREINKEIYQSVQQTSIIFLTTVLAVTAFFDFLNKAYSNSLFVWFYVLAISLLSLGSYIIFRRSIK